MPALGPGALCQSLLSLLLSVLCVSSLVYCVLSKYLPRLITCMGWDQTKEEGAVDSTSVAACSARHTREAASSLLFLHPLSFLLASPRLTLAKPSCVRANVRTPQRRTNTLIVDRPTISSVRHSGAGPCPVLGHSLHPRYRTGRPAVLGPQYHRSWLFASAY